MDLFLAFYTARLFRLRTSHTKGAGKGRFLGTPSPTSLRPGPTTPRPPAARPPRRPDRGRSPEAQSRRPGRARENRLEDPAPPPPTHLRRAQPLRSSSAPAHPRHPTGHLRPLRLLLLGELETRPPFHWPAAPSVYPRERRVKGARGGEAGPALIGQSAVPSARQIGRRDPRRPQRAGQTPWRAFPLGEPPRRRNERELERIQTRVEVGGALGWRRGPPRPEGARGQRRG